MRESFRLHWPTDSLIVIQPFGANVLYYRRLQLPGHPGVDLEATPGSEVRAPAPGTVVSAHGGRVRTRHESGQQVYEITLDPLAEIAVSPGASVRGASLLGRAAGDYVSLHLHKRGATARHETTYPDDQIDPTPYLVRPDATVRVGVPHTSLREQPLARAPRIADVPWGDPLRVVRGWRTFELRLGQPKQWLYVEALTGDQGWVHADHVTPLGADTGFASAAPDPLRVRVTVAIARLRDGPGTDYRVVNQLSYGTPLVVVSDIGNAPPRVGMDDQWLNVRTPSGQVGWIAAWLVVHAEPASSPRPSPILQPPSWPFGRCLVGLHGDVDAFPFQDRDYETIQVSQVEAVKLLTPGHGVETIRRLRDMNADMFLLARLFANPGDSPLSPDQFVDAVRDGVAAFVREGVVYFEIHNEPNLDLEGLFKGWNNGTQFNAWYSEVLSQLRELFTAARFGFPGLSPGPAIPGRRQEWISFLDECSAGIQQSAWIGAHCYWQTEDEMWSADGGQAFRTLRGRYPDKLLLITEFSNPAPGVPFDVKADQYVRYYQLLRDEPGIGAAFSFVLSASGRFENENWRVWNDGLTPIPYKVGTRSF